MIDEFGGGNSREGRGTEMEYIMANSALISAISISIALIGVTLNVIFIKPYPGVAIVGNRNKEKLYKLRQKMGWIANILIIIGTAGQSFSLICTLIN